MTRTIKHHTLTAILFALLAAASFGAEVAADIALPPPRTDGGKPLMQALKLRQSTRIFSAEKIPVQTLSDLLWAAFGINRSDSGKRTAPSTWNSQEIEIYAVMEEGAYLYDAASNTLKLVAASDLRTVTGKQPFVASAPLNLVFVADGGKMKKAKADDIRFYAAADAGFISQNVYLFCASEGLSTVVRGMVDHDACAKALKLPTMKKVLLAQTVGFPKSGGK